MSRRSSWIGEPLRASTRRIVSVPTYAFQRERYWIADATVGSEPARTTDQWATDNAYSVVWQRHGAAAAEPQATPAGVWLVLVDDQGLGSAISGALRARGARCIEVRAGAETVQESADCWQVAPDQRDGFERVLSPLRGPGVTQVVDCWPLDAPSIDQATSAALEATHVKTCGAILHLSQALNLLAMPARMWVVTRDAIAVRRDERPSGVLQSTA